jgi:hypothetical protein
LEQDAGEEEVEDGVRGGGEQDKKKKAIYTMLARAQGSPKTSPSVAQALRELIDREAHNIPGPILPVYRTAYGYVAV